MLNLQCIRLFQVQLKISRFIGGIPFYWKQEQNLPGKVCHQTPKIFSKWNLISLMTLLWCSFLYARFVYVVFWKRTVSTEVILQFIIWLMVHTGALVIGSQLFTKREAICLEFNGILTLWLNHFRGKGSCLHCILLVWVIGSIIAPICVASVFWFEPCAPQFLYSVMFSCCSNVNGCRQDGGPTAKIFYFVLETILLSQISAFAPMIIFLVIIPLSCFNECLSEIRRSCKGRRMFKSKLPFLREAMLYRQVQYLIKLYSEIFQDYILPTLISAHSVCTIVSMFDVINRMNSSGKGDPVGYIIYITLLAMSVGFEGIFMEFASKPIKRSKQVKGRWKQIQFTQNNEWLEKFEMSCPILKIYTRPSVPVGRDKLALFLRFSLQRTIFFVVYNRQS